MAILMSQKAIDMCVSRCDDCGRWERENKMFISKDFPVRERKGWPEFTLHLCKDCALKFVKEIIEKIENNEK